MNWNWIGSFLGQAPYLGNPAADNAVQPVYRQDTRNYVEPAIAITLLLIVMVVAIKIITKA